MKSRSPDIGGSAWWWRASLIILAVAIGVYLFAPTEADPDLWGHLRFGLDLLDSGRIVRVDPYSYLTGDQLWINHEWLSEALMAIAYRAAGVSGLVVLKVAIGFSIALMLVWHLRSVGISLLGAFLITAYGVAVILPGFRSLRPQVFTYAAFLIILLLVHRIPPSAHPSMPPSTARRSSAGRWLWLAPPLFALWANLHGGFVAGLGVFVFVAIVLAGLGRRGALLPALVACLATLVNPYGIGLWTFLRRTLGPRPDIAEWQAISIGTAEGVAYLAVVAFGAIAIPALIRVRAWLALMLLVGGALLPFVARRHLPLFVLITIVMCAEHTAAAIGRLFARAPHPPRTTPQPTSQPSTQSQADAQPQASSSDRFRPIVAAAMIFQAVVLLAIALPQLTRIRVDPTQFPIAPTAWLAASGVSANLAVDFDWGEYVIWHAGPRVKVSVDGRRETVYSDAAYEQNLRFTGGADGWDGLLTPSDLALVSVRTRAFALLSQRADWLLLMHDETCGCALFGRIDSPATAALRATPRPVPGAMPSAASPSSSQSQPQSQSESQAATDRRRAYLFP
jgi:hypothetical protein